MTVSNESRSTGVLILVDLRAGFGDCSSLPLARFGGLSLLVCALHCELPVSALAALGALSAVRAPHCGQPVVRDIPSGSVATFVLEIEVPSRYLLFSVLPPFLVSVMPDWYNHFYGHMWVVIAAGHFLAACVKFVFVSSWSNRAFLFPFVHL